ncbi:GNAT family N-acetyltransferase [Sphingomonas sp. ABOLE]|nr:GNAT family N-acetyltransferase [Sphingomonas sp. ABOLE]
MHSAIYPRTFETFQDLVWDRSVWCAVMDDGTFVGMSYAHFDAGQHEWEIGGLMVDDTARGKGLGAILMRLPLIHMLLNEDPLALARKPTIVTHVLAGNQAPRRIIPEAGFAFQKSVKIPGHVLPGLPTDDEGFVNGDEFHLAIPDALDGLANWCEAWNGQLRDGTAAHVDMRGSETLALWAEALRDMALRARA